MAARGRLLSVREAAKFPKDAIHGLSNVGRLQRPRSSICEGFLICVENFFFAITFIMLEEFVDRIVELAMQDGLETAFGGIQLF